MAYTAVFPDEISSSSTGKESSSGTKLSKEQVIAQWEGVLWSSSNSHAGYWETARESQALSLKGQTCAMAISPSHSSCL